MEDLTVILQARHLTSLYTCDGENLSPDLDIGRVDRSKTRSLALIVEDPDTSKGTLVH